MLENSQELVEHPIKRQIHTNLIQVGKYAEFLPDTESAQKRLKELEEKEQLPGTVIPILLEEGTQYQVNQYYDINHFHLPFIEDVFSAPLYSSEHFNKNVNHIIVSLIRSRKNQSSYSQMVSIHLFGANSIPNQGEFLFEGMGKPYKIKWYISKQSPARIQSIITFRIELVIEISLSMASNHVHNHLGYTEKPKLDSEFEALKKEISPSGVSPETIKESVKSLGLRVRAAQ